MFEHVQIPVHLCCNDPDSGNFAGELWGLEIGGNLEFSGHYIDWGPRLRYVWGDKPRIVLAGKHFPITYHKEWYGNWCWDLVKMEGQHVIELLNWPRLRKWFDLESGEARLFNWWHAGKRWTDNDLRLISKSF